MTSLLEELNVDDFYIRNVHRLCIFYPKNSSLLIMDDFSIKKEHHLCLFHWKRSSLMYFVSEKNILLENILVGYFSIRKGHL